MRITEAFRQYGVELKNPQFTSSAVGGDPRQVVVSLWAHNFQPDRSRYVGDTSQWKGQGKHFFRRHLQQALDEGLPIRVVVATSERPDEVTAGNAARVRNDFEPDFSLVGQVASLSSNGFELTFDRMGVAPNSDGNRSDRAPVKYWHVAEAVTALGGPSSIANIRAWLKERYPTENHSDAGDNLTLLTVNDANRRHHNKARTDWRSTSSHPQDLVFRQGRLREVTYEPFNANVHGHWSLQQNGDGTWVAVKIASTPELMVEAQALQEAFEHQPPLDSEHDARVWSMRAVAQRRGQPLFRARLLDAYGGRCAITGCSAVDVLEAAHVLPYRGDHTDRIDNGLLLRADLHTLFDCGLLWVTEEQTVALAPSLLQTDYAHLQGVPLRLPQLATNRPNPAHLKEHGDRCRARLAN